ncbi:MAG TPA: alpha/beta-hydrolase family protein, partial [Intrasporangium sp.]|nr:alpha/beta-hydrolase family protein [Intrasporangium sp.]
QAIEYLSNGDSAVAAMQYSYVPSAVALLSDRGTPREAGKVLFDRIHAVWSTLPEADRPQLVVSGESLGSYGGQAAFKDSDDMLRKAEGGVWVGTPSFTEIHEELTSARTPGSPEIAPVINDGKHFRFATNADELTHDYNGRDYGEWAFPRYVYAQHPSDPVVWWNPALLGAEPDWLREPLGRDVNPDVTWIPFVTFWQLTTDMAVGHDPADGFGHRYGAELVPAWGAVLGGQPGQDYSRIIAGVNKTVHRAK